MDQARLYNFTEIRYNNSNYPEYIDHNGDVIMKPVGIPLKKDGTIDKRFKFTRVLDHNGKPLN